MAKQSVFFPGSNTCAGFMGFFDGLHSRARRTVILKGGPGVGKSTLMRQAGAIYEKKGMDVQYFRCSGDPDSLDAVLVPAADFLILDGTAPHIVDPRLPRARDGILNLGVCLNEAQLAGQAAGLASVSRSIAGCYARATRYLRAAAEVRSDAAAALDEALSRKGRRSLEEELQLPDGPEGEEHHLYVQAITWKGVVQETDSLSCGAAICIDAPWGFDVHALLMPLWDAARRSRLRRLICHDPLDASCVAHIAVGGTVFSSAVWPEARVLTPPAGPERAGPGIPPSGV